MPCHLDKELFPLFPLLPHILVQGASVFQGTFAEGCFKGKLKRNTSTIGGTNHFVWEPPPPPALIVGGGGDN